MGQKAEVAAFPEHVGCSPNNGHSSRRAARLLCAKPEVTGAPVQLRGIAHGPKEPLQSGQAAKVNPKIFS